MRDSELRTLSRLCESGNSNDLGRLQRELERRDGPMPLVKVKHQYKWVFKANGDFDLCVPFILGMFKPIWLPVDLRHILMGDIFRKNS